MDESAACGVRSNSGCLIEQPQSFFCEPGDLGHCGIDFECDLVDPRPGPCDELGDSRIVTGALQELDSLLPGKENGDANSLARDLFDAIQSKTQLVAVQADGFFEVLDCDAYVVQALDHVLLGEPSPFH